jgi:chromosome segregation ATPase
MNRAIREKNQPH